MKCAEIEGGHVGIPDPSGYQEAVYDVRSFEEVRHFPAPRRKLAPKPRTATSETRPVVVRTIVTTRRTPEIQC